MSPELFVSQLINGLGIGLIYFLVAVGFSIVFGLMNFVNFAHGAFFLIGAYFVHDLLIRGVLLWFAIPLSAILVGIVGLIVEQLTLTRLYRVDHAYQIVATFAIGLLFQELITYFWGPNPISATVPPPLSGTVQLGDYGYPTYRLIVVGTALLVGLVIYIVIERTRVGAMLRAGSESISISSILGLRVNRMFAITFAVSAGLAGLAGALSVPMRSLTPASGLEMMALAVAVVVVGKIGSYRGAFVAAIAIGVIQSLTVAIAPSLGSAVVYGLMIIAILARADSVRNLVAVARSNTKREVTQR